MKKENCPADGNWAPSDTFFIVLECSCVREFLGYRKRMDGQSQCTPQTDDDFNDGRHMLFEPFRRRAICPCAAHTINIHILPDENDKLRTSAYRNCWLCCEANKPLATMHRRFNDLLAISELFIIRLAHQKIRTSYCTRGQLRRSRNCICSK